MGFDKGYYQTKIAYINMKVIWFSNVDISVSTMSGSGTWVMAMARALCSHDQSIEITNISMSSIDDDIAVESGRIRQIKIKAATINEDFVGKVHGLISKINPVLLHVWGTEAQWATFPFKTSLPILVDMQGIVSSVHENFYGGLTPAEVRKCWKLKECLKPTSSLQYGKHVYKSLIEREKQVIKSLKYVSVQSKWVEGYIRALNPTCQIYHTGIALRPEFYTAKKWQDVKEPIIFSTATMVTPLKGLHVLLKALSIVKMYYPNVELRLAGDVQAGLRVGGYAKMLNKYISTNDIGSNVKFLGVLNTEELIKEYQSAAVVVNPSSVESYSLVVAEAMHIGSPVVASYVGGMADLGFDKSSIIYFPKEDYISCAFKIMNLLTSSELCKEISQKAILLSERRCNRDVIASTQIAIYKELINNN